MPNTNTRLLIVDDEPSIRTSLSLVLAEIGYSVQCADDGFSALVELRLGIPDFLISDLNMPGMSGFELLSVVRRRFPEVRTIATSGAFSGTEVPSGVAADAFYQRGSSIGSLLRIMSGLTQMEQRLPRRCRKQPILRFEWSGQDAPGTPHVEITCPECLRIFSAALSSPINAISTADCIHCRAPIQYVISKPASPVLAQISVQPSRRRRHLPVCPPQIYC